MEQKIRWGIIGTGWIAEKMAEGLTAVEDATLVAVGSRAKGKANEFARRHRVGTAYGSYEEIAADPGIDVVYIATPHPYHCANTLMCLRSGKAVL